MSNNRTTCYIGDNTWVEIEEGCLKLRKHRHKFETDTIILGPAATLSLLRYISGNKQLNDILTEYRTRL